MSSRAGHFGLLYQLAKVGQCRIQRQAIKIFSRHSLHSDQIPLQQYLEVVRNGWARERHALCDLTHIQSLVLSQKHQNVLAVLVTQCIEYRCTGTKTCEYVFECDDCWFQNNQLNGYAFNLLNGLYITNKLLRN